MLFTLSLSSFVIFNFCLANTKPNVDPSPSFESNKIDPPSAIIIFFTINKPKPVPSGRFLLEILKAPY